ncbi:hypothetical protein V7x_55990 [Crateriforma conspicua]|uniref:DUF2007 domain-containing protein n=1 Tax=Crateriforma conspicua TaxID=2527996 RepID=A0A5C6FIN7_9PLAN|nr:DUF2007 domain-containing protein [Crateriforma conspicua]TWU59521.1 hypothetical protein V7x_55990 [Crateriforma conspicua]
MELKNPIAAYTANGNLEAHAVVNWLESNGIRAYAVEDNSGVSLFAFGTLSQFHKPQVFVDESDIDRAGDFLGQFELQRAQRRKDLDDSPPIVSECEECGVASEFPASQNDTTQNCPKCHAFMDVGTSQWPDDFDFGDAELDSEFPKNVDDAIAAASKLEKVGDWDEAIEAFREAADRWPDHATYIRNCIAEIERKRDATR